MAGKKTTGGYDQGVYLERLQDIANAIADLDSYLFANDVPSEDIELGKLILKDANKQGVAALERKKSKIDVAAFAMASKSKSKSE